MAKLHEFWILPKGLNFRVDDYIEERIAFWGNVSFDPESMDEAEELQYYLWGYCEDKAYAASRVNDRMVMDSFQSFLPVRTLRKGFLPCFGLPLTDFAVIPCMELPGMADIISTLPPYAAWRRLRELCLEAFRENRNLLYRGVIS